MSGRYVLVFTPNDEESPTSTRTYPLDAALEKAERLNRSSVPGRWTVHELSEAVAS